MSSLSIVPILRAIVMSAALVRPVFAQELVRVAIPTETSARAATMPVGERLEYDVRFGKLHVGSGSMEIRETTDVRGRVFALHDITIKPDDKNAYDVLSFELTAKTFRYLDDTEVAAEKSKAEPVKGKKGKKKKGAGKGADTKSASVG